MLTKSEQAVYRPLVEKAWLQHCVLMGLSPNNKPAKDAWYRDQVHGAIGVWSTRDADPDRDYQPLLDRFMLLAGDPQVIVVKGWSPSQTEWFTKEAHKSYEAGLRSGLISREVEFNSWACEILESHGIHNHHAPDRRESFDQVMAQLATISNDDHLIDHFSQATEIRARWQISRYMADLEWLEGNSVTWDYVKAIWTQAELLPASIADAPASTLIKVLQMLDTHIRRICREKGIRPRCIPSRCDPIRCRDHTCPSGHPSSDLLSVPILPSDDIPF